MTPLHLLAMAAVSMTYSTFAQAAKIPLTILHTNDVHSHYKPDKGPEGLGGIARLSTQIHRQRAQAKNSILIDAGDWSEGNIYYNLEAGRASLEMMNALGYDVSVVGNHDWLNGPDQLLKILGQVSPRFPVLAANVDATNYSRAGEFSEQILPYTFINTGGIRIAVIGLLTYEFIYDKFFAPIEITSPFNLTRKLAAKLHKDADLVVVISHNGLATNKVIAGLPNVDIVIGAHDHMKLTKPVVIERGGKTSLIVEAECWGYYLGRLDIVVDTKTKTYELKNYELVQVDSTVPEDPLISSLVDSYDHQLTRKYGDIFHDHLADSNIEITRDGTESLLGDLATDAYREFTGADVSFEQIAFTSDSLHKGPLNTADIYNALTFVHNPFTHKSWTLKTMRMTGKTISRVMNSMLSLGSYIPRSMLSVSGLHVVYDPVLLDQDPDQTLTATDRQIHLIKDLEIGGKPVDPKRKYLVAVPQGINEAIEFIQLKIGIDIDRTDVQDTGVEDWRVLATYLQRHSPIDSATIARGGRITMLKPDLALYGDEIKAKRSDSTIHALVTVRNMGSTASQPRSLTVTYDKTPRYFGDDPNPETDGVKFSVPTIPAGGTATVSVGIALPDQTSNDRLPVYFLLDRDQSDRNKTNDSTWLML